MSVDWTAVGAFATAGGAVATAGAAAVTAWMAAMTRKSIRHTQEHHRDAFRPLVVFMPYDGIDPLDRKGLVNFHRPSEGGLPHQLLLNGTLQNIGVGPALNLRLLLAVMNPQDVSAVCELSPMKNNECRQGPYIAPGGLLVVSRQFPLTVPLRLSPGFNDTDFQMAPNSPWSIILEYEDIFGRRFRSRHASSRSAPWTTTEVWRQSQWVSA